MSKEAVFTMKLEPELRDEFMAEAEAAHRPASQVLRELMRELIQHQREAREYDEFLRSKVEAGRTLMQVGRGRSNDEVEATFAVQSIKKTKSAPCLKRSSGQVLRMSASRGADHMSAGSLAAKLQEHNR